MVILTNTRRTKATQKQSSSSDLAGLYSLRASLGIRARDWPRRADPCTSWTGVTCSASGRVVALDISGLRRTRVGHLSPQFAVDGLRNLTQLRSFNATGIALPGFIPDWLGADLAPTFATLVFRDASVAGSIPYSLDSLRNLRSLQNLSLGSNSISGALTDRLLAGLTPLQSVVLSHNNFSGALPDSLWYLSELRVFDVSGNRHTEVLPDIVPAAVKSNVSGALFDLSSNLYYDSISTRFGSMFTKFVMLNISINYLEVEQQENGGAAASSGGGIQAPGVSVNLTAVGKAFSYEQLVRATADFSDMNLVKHGRSGGIYRGALENGLPIVVKRINVLASQDARVVELDLFSNGLHERLVPFLGHCLGKENEKFLVYEYVPNGDLHPALQRKPEPEGGVHSLHWIKRLKIATGIAQALYYLHHECSPPLQVIVLFNKCTVIICRDIQTSSILLDDKFEVRLGSLSEVCPQEEAHHNVIARLFCMSQSSEQCVSEPPTTCAYDVHCLGKVLLELVTGKLGIRGSNDAAA
ncbi:unnamed protein product, partial [Musa textilis]